MFNIFLKIFIKKFGVLKNSATFTSSNKNQNQMTTKNPDGSVTNTTIAITPTQALAQLEGCKAALVQHLGGGGYMSADLLGKKLDTLIECAKLYQLAKNITFLNDDEVGADADKLADDRYNEMRDTNTYHPL